MTGYHYTVDRRGNIVQPELHGCMYKVATLSSGAPKPCDAVAIFTRYVEQKLVYLCKGHSEEKLTMLSIVWGETK